LFEEKLKKTPLTVCFPEYDGNSVDEAYQFIGETFLARNPLAGKDFEMHVTCALDQSNVDAVFNAVRTKILQHVLGNIGVINS